MIVSRGTSSSTHRASLASCYQRLGEYGKALEHAKLAVEADTGDSDVKWMHEVLSRQKMAVDKMCQAEATLQGKSSYLKMPEPVQVQCMCSTGRGSICLVYPVRGSHFVSRLEVRSHALIVNLLFALQDMCGNRGVTFANMCRWKRGTLMTLVSESSSSAMPSHIHLL